MEMKSVGAGLWEFTRPANAPREPAALMAAQEQGAEGDDGDVREAFQSFVGQTLFGQLLGAMRKTVGKPAYFHGGRAEEMFRQQLDQVLAEKMADASGGRYSDAMYDLFTMPRR